MLKADKPQSNYEPIPAGSYPARLYSIIVIGTEFFEWMGEKKSSKKIRLTFELPTETKEFKEGDGEKPFVISQEFGFSMGKKSKMRPMVEGWLGKSFVSDDEAYEFDIESLLGKDCLLSVAENEKGYSFISNVSPMPKGMKCPVQVNPSTMLSFDNWDEELFEKLPEFLRDKISKTPEYKSMREFEGHDYDKTQEEAGGEISKEDLNNVGLTD